MRATSRDVLVSLALLLTACADLDVDKGPEEELPTDGKLDSFAKPTDHGPLAPGATASSRLTATERHHTWDFTLGAAADLKITTGPSDPSGDEVDTVLYLYKQKADGRWGAYIARNDDGKDTLWSSLSRSLGAGHYRVLVKGYSTSARGNFAVTLGCTGDGCATPSCLLGDTYHDLLQNPAYNTYRSVQFTGPAELESLEREQVIAALHESSHTDVRTVEEAFARVDDGVITLTELAHDATGSLFIAIEYGAGDNAYGAVFWYHTLDRAAAIHDGDLYSCVFQPAPTGRQLGQLCAAKNACAAELTCLGLAGGRGVCVPRQDPPGDGTSCSLDQPCPGTQLTCAGLTRGDEGLCFPEWLGRSYDDLGPFAVPAGDLGGLTRHLTVFGLATVDMDVSLSLTVNHPDVRNLRITLANPGGTEAVVYDGGATGTTLTLDGPVIGFSGDESVNGSWTLRVQDKTGAQAGTLTGWHLYVMSRWD